MGFFSQFLSIKWGYHEIMCSSFTDNSSFIFSLFFLSCKYVWSTLFLLTPIATKRPRHFYSVHLFLFTPSPHLFSIVKCRVKRQEWRFEQGLVQYLKCSLRTNADGGGNLCSFFGGSQLWVHKTCLFYFFVWVYVCICVRACVYVCLGRGVCPLPKPLQI